MSTKIEMKNSDENGEREYKVLLVEDDIPDLVLGKNRILDIWPSADITSARTLSDAYELVMKYDFDLVLLDLNLPDAYGPATVQQMRSFNKKVPIIVLTGMGNDRTVSQAIKLGANHVTLKPNILNDDFLNILEQHVSQ